MTHECYNRTCYPHFIVNNGNWDIYADDAGKCAAIPTPDAEAKGCLASHFGDLRHVERTLGVRVAA